MCDYRCDCMNVCQSMCVRLLSVSLRINVLEYMNVRVCL